MEDRTKLIVTQGHETLLTKCFIGKTGGASWLGLMKKAFRSPVKENHMRSSRRREEAEQEEEEKKRGKRRWIFRKPTLHETTINHKQEADATTNTSSSTSKRNLATNLLPENNADLKQRGTNAVAMPTTLGIHKLQILDSPSNETADATARAAVNIIRLTRPTISVKEQRAVLTIQTAFRGYLARKALGALKGLVKLQALIRGHNVRKRAKMTLQCMQSLVRVQTQVCDQRRRLSCEGINCGSIFREPKSILELHLGDKESTSTNLASTVDDGYDHSRALEKVEALLQKAKEAAKKRENSLASAFSRKMWTLDKDENESSNKELDEDLRIFHCRASCDQPRDRKKNIETDTACSYYDSDPEFWRLQHHYYQDQQRKFYSYAVPSPLSHRANVNGLPMTPPTFKMKNILFHSASPRCRREEKSNHRMAALLSHRANVNGLSRNSANSEPNYMAATASARARGERSQSAPRQMPMTPEREKPSAAKKRLSFPIP
ncbi:protein IQ-DOMAIN 17-like isoform X2 [Lycium barbarum]|uniref:protein IQ-DOMAIN 17-like isoform X2 n=1 Tax=Lycium barbarum TaxID=112863 RepID=UPI00293E9351|nr:protein IQ-DOMAIN 17-like isoform X2 [Lycium barbarum]